MEFRQLNYFVKVAEMLNFSEAAKVLCVSQGTLSQQIKQLENELGVSLFQRNSHSVALTEAGQALLPCAIATLHNARECTERINDLRKLLIGTLNIGITYTFGPILTETLVTFMHLHPNVKLNIVYKPMTELMDMLQRRQVDFVLAFKPTKSYEHIESQILFDNHLALVVNSRHPLAQRKSISPAELREVKLALPATGLQARLSFDHMLSRFGISTDDLQVNIELNEVNILLKIIKERQLATVLAEATIHNESDLRAIHLDFAHNEMAGCVHTLKDAYRKQSAVEFIRMLSDSNAIRLRMHNWI